MPRPNLPRTTGFAQLVIARTVVSTRSLLAASALLAVSLVAIGCADPYEPRSVFVFLIDTVRRDALGCYGNPDHPTPHLDAIAADGVRFDQAISSSGWTLPSVASLLTGTWPTLHGAKGKNVELTPLRDEIGTIPEVFQSAGFRTSAFANAAFVSPMLRIDRGFDVFDHRHSYNWDTRRADETIETALQWVRQHRAERQFVLIHLFDAHLTYHPPHTFAAKFTGGRYEPLPPLTMDMCLALQAGENSPPPAEDIEYVRDVYQGEVAFLDAQVGRFVEALRELDLYDGATIIVVADHGEEFWDHGGFEHGHTLYDELVRVPLLLKLPRDVEVAERSVDAQVRIIDILPTALELFGLDAPATNLGRSLLPLIRGQADDPRIAFSESTLYGSNQLAWRTGRYKYIVDLDSESGDGRLYDWRADPGEQDDLAKSKPDVALRMHDELHGFAADLKERAKALSKPKTVDLSPRRIEQLRALGYIRD